MTRFTLSAAILMASVAAAQAGPYVAPPAPLPVIVGAERCAQAFDCFYIGLEYGIVQGEGEDETPNRAFPLPFDDGTAWGGFAGYNIQNDNLVFGGEARVLHLSDFQFDGDYEIEMVTDLRGRVGLATGNLMFYGALGISSAEFTSGVFSSDLTGYNAGLGAEFNVSDNIFLRVDATTRELTGDGFAGDDLTQTINTFTLGAGFRF